MGRKRIILTDRDKAIFCYLFEQKVAFLKDIQERFFKDKHRTTCIARLQKLVRYSLIKKLGCEYNERLVIYFALTDFGFSAIRELYCFEREKVRLKSDAIKHDLHLTKARNRLEQTKMVQSYYSENYMQNCFLGEYHENLLPLRRINADAGLRLSTKLGEFFVSFEYERSKKNLSRYAKKFTDYYFDSSITAILYLCQNEEINRAIRKVDKEISKGFSPKVFTLTTKEMEKADKILPFTNQNGDIFKLH